MEPIHINSRKWITYPLATALYDAAMAAKYGPRLALNIPMEPEPLDGIHDVENCHRENCEILHKPPVGYHG